MKTVYFTVAALSVVCSFCSAQELMVDCESRSQVRPTSVAYKDFVSHEIGKGRSGNAFRIVCPPERAKLKDKNARFQTQHPLKIVSASKPVLSRVYLKGKGKIWFGLVVSDRNRRVFWPAGLLKSFKVDSPDKWTSVELIYTPAAGSPYANKAAYVLPYINIGPGSEFLLDDWEVKFIDNNKEIVIEE